MKICPGCRRSVSGTAQFCQNCGTKMGASQRVARTGSRDYDPVIHPNRSLEWSKALMRAGLDPLSSQQRQAINGVLAKTGQPLLGSVPDEVEIVTVTVSTDSFWSSLGKAFIMGQNYTKIKEMSAYDGKGKSVFRIEQGRFLITNRRFLTYQSKPQNCWQTPLSRLNRVEYDSDSGQFKLFADNGSYYAIEFIFPFVSLGTAANAVSKDSRFSSISQLDIQVRGEQARDARTLVRSLFDELVHNARQLRY